MQLSLDRLNELFQVVGNTLFNMLRLGEVETDENERPVVVQKILKAVILNNPFPDIVPREKVREKEKKKKKKAEKKEGKR